METTLPTINLLSANSHPLSFDETVQYIGNATSNKQWLQHCVVNVAKIVNMRSDPELRQAVNSCDLINIDGTGVVWGARLLGHHVPERVAGIDLFWALLMWASKHNESVFLLGAKEDVIRDTVTALEKSHPNLNIAGSHDGYFWDDEEVVVKQIRDSGASMLFVAITSPKKEIFINKWKEQLGVCFAMGVGGTFDIVAGRSKRAPLWMQKSGLEWFYRILQEPRRMWKRYLVTNTNFACLLFKALLSGERSRVRRARRDTAIESGKD